VEAYKPGRGGVLLGAGRNRTDDPVHPDVGIVFEKKRGDRVKRGENLLRYYAERSGDAEAAGHRNAKCGALRPRGRES